jgi:drug/metabolite transporter (DMT)-like permease
VDSLSLPALGALCALGSAVTWAGISLLVRTLNPPFNSVAINAIRTTASGALLLAWILLGQGAAPLEAISGQNLGLLVVSIVLAIGVGDTVFFESTRRLGLGRGMTIAMSYPLVAAALAAVFLDEAITLRLAAGALLTLAGLAVIVVSRGEEATAGHAWWLGVGGATLAAVAWGVSSVLLKAPLGEVEPITAQAVRLPVAGILLFATPWARGAVRALGASEAAVVWQVVVLSLLTALSSVLFVAGLKYAGVAVATVLSSTAPMFAIPLGLIFLGARLSLRPVVGAAITVAGIAVLQL